MPLSALQKTAPAHLSDPGIHARGRPHVVQHEPRSSLPAARRLQHTERHTPTMRSVEARCATVTSRRTKPSSNVATGSARQVMLLFFSNGAATAEIYPLPRHDPLLFFLKDPPPPDISPLPPHAPLPI